MPNLAKPAHLTAPVRLAESRTRVALATLDGVSAMHGEATRALNEIRDLLGIEHESSHADIVAAVRLLVR